MSYIKKSFWRLLYAVISTILNLRVHYLRGEIPVPEEDGLFGQIFMYFVVYPLLIILAWFWGHRDAYKTFTAEYKNPISYETYLTIGTVFFFVLMMLFIVISFIFPVPATYHYGR